MDMKKFLQAVDGASSKKPVGGSSDMKKFMQIVEGKGPLNRLTAAESMTMQSYSNNNTKDITNPVLNIEVGAKPGMIGKYFKSVEKEIAEAEDRTKERARKLAERVMERITLPDPDDPQGQEKVAAQIANKQAMSQQLSAQAQKPQVTDVKNLQTAEPQAFIGQKQYRLELKPALFPRQGQQVQIPGELIGEPGVVRKGIIFQDWIFVYPATNEGVPRLSKHIDQSKIPPESLNRRAKNFAGKRLKW